MAKTTLNHQPNKKIKEDAKKLAQFWLRVYKQQKQNEVAKLQKGVKYLWVNYATICIIR